MKKNLPTPLSWHLNSILVLHENMQILFLLQELNKYFTDVWWQIWSVEFCYFGKNVLTFFGFLNFICLCSLEPPLVCFFLCEKLLHVAEESKFQKESLKYTSNINVAGLTSLLCFCDNSGFLLCFCDNSSFQLCFILFYLVLTTLLHYYSLFRLFFGAWAPLNWQCNSMFIVSVLPCVTNANELSHRKIHMHAFLGQL